MAHIRSILPQRGGVSPVDNNTAFLAHYDEHPHDNLKGLKAIGNQKAFYFNGSTRIDTAFKTDNMQQITVECWIYPSRNNTTDTYISSAESAGISFECVTGKPQIAVNTGGSYKVAASTEQLGINQWYHLAGVYDGTNVIMYVNGVAKATVACTGVITPSSQKITLAANPPGTGSPYQGRMSNARLWNFGLSQSQVVSAMNNQLTDGIVAQWKLDEGAGSVAYDCSGGGNDGAIVGTTSWVEGKAVYSLSSGGYPGGNGKGVLLEDSVVNEITAPDWSTFGSYGGFTINQIDEPESITGKGLLMTMTTSGANTSGRVTPTRAASGDSGNHTFSVYAKGGPTSIGKNIRIYTGVGWYSYAGTERLSNTYQRFVFPDLTYSTASGGLGIGIDGWVLNDDLYLHSPQLEGRNYATSFVVGSRSTANLQYPISVMNATEGTISFWAKLRYSLPYTATSVNDLWVTTAGTYGGALSLNMWAQNNNYNDRIIGVHWADASGNNNHVPLALSQVPQYNNGEWNMYAITWNSATGYKVYINGVLAGTGNTNLPLRPFDASVIDFKGMTMDELRIDSIARTNTEIAAWYYQGRNGW
jgi:hypothetical protein